MACSSRAVRLSDQYSLCCLSRLVSLCIWIASVGRCHPSDRTDVGYDWVSDGTPLARRLAGACDHCAGHVGITWKGRMRITLLARASLPSARSPDRERCNGGYAARLRIECPIHACHPFPLTYSLSTRGTVTAPCADVWFSI